MSQPSLQLVEKDGSVVDAVSLDIEECLTLESFASLIELYEYHSKTFIIARVKSCDRRDHTKHHYTHYSAHQLNKALFRKKGTEIFSRYHKSCPIVALNPFTNEDIVGEVHYYQVVPLPRKQETTSEIPEGKIQISQGEVIDDMNGLQASMALETGTRQVDSPRQKSIKATYIAEQEDTTGEVQIPDIHDPSSLSLPNLVSTEKECTPSVEVGQTTQQEQRMAICIGTDYNYIHSEDLQKIFLDNGIGDDSNILALSSSMQIHRNPMNLGDEPEMENLFNRIRAMQGRHRRRRVFYVPYHRAVSLGVAAAIYVTYCVAVFAISVQNLRNLSQERSSVWVWSFLPFLIFVFDRYVSSILESHEHKRVVVAKLVIAGIYIFLPEFIYTERGTSYCLFRNVLNAIAACVAMSYSRWLYIKSIKGKIMV